MNPVQGNVNPMRKGNLMATRDASYLYTLFATTTALGVAFSALLGPQALAKPSQPEAVTRAVATVDVICSSSDLDTPLFHPLSGEPPWSASSAPTSEQRRQFIDWARATQRKLCGDIRTCFANSWSSALSQKDLPMQHPMPKPPKISQYDSDANERFAEYQLRLAEYNSEKMKKNSMDLLMMDEMEKCAVPIQEFDGIVNPAFEATRSIMKAKYWEAQKQVMSTVETSQPDTLLPYLSDLWFAARVYGNLATFAHLVHRTGSEIISPAYSVGFSGWESDLRGRLTQLVPNAEMEAYQVTQSKVSAYLKRQRVALCDAEVPASGEFPKSIPRHGDYVSMVKIAQKCSEARRLKGSEVPEAIEPFWEACSSLTSDGLAALDAAISGECFVGEVEEGLREIVEVARGSSDGLSTGFPVGKQFSLLSKALDDSKKSQSVCVKVAQPLSKKDPVLNWKRCMSNIDLSSTARRYAATDRDLYDDHMRKGALSCASSVGISGQLVSFYKECPFAESKHWYFFVDPEDGYPDSIYKTDTETIEVEEAVVESKGFTSPP
jgi:hypothetical protein